MRVAILSALNAELETLLATAADVEHTDIGSWTLWSGSIEDREVILARAGLGKVNTAALAGIIWERHRPETILFTGVAGGLDPSLDIGDIVIGERTIQHDWGSLPPVGSSVTRRATFPSTIRLRNSGSHLRINSSQRRKLPPTPLT